ncbi:MAG: hypothetical protein WCH99_05530 [Verrucomicrobiota bacterium]
MKTQKVILSLAVGAFLLLGLSARAATPSPSLSALKSVPLAELPGKAAALVAAADAKSQIQTAVDVTKSGIGLNPAAAPAIVGAISARVPETAAIVAATAASLLPKQAVALAKIAAAAAPKFAGKIAEAVCAVAPNLYKEIAQAVADAVPGAAREVLTGLAAAIPSLKASIDNALAMYKAPSVNLVLSQIPATATVAATATMASGMDVSPNVKPVPSPINFPGAPVVLDPGSTGQVPTGGHNYSVPTATTNTIPLG